MQRFKHKHTSAFSTILRFFFFVFRVSSCLIVSSDRGNALCNVSWVLCSGKCFFFFFSFFFFFTIKMPVLVFERLSCFFRWSRPRGTGVLPGWLQRGLHQGKVRSSKHPRARFLMSTNREFSSNTPLERFMDAGKMRAHASLEEPPLLMWPIASEHNRPNTHTHMDILSLYSQCELWSLSRSPTLPSCTGSCHSPQDVNKHDSRNHMCTHMFYTPTVVPHKHTLALTHLLHLSHPSHD